MRRVSSVLAILIVVTCTNLACSDVTAALWRSKVPEIEIAAVLLDSMEGFAYTVAQGFPVGTVVKHRALTLERQMVLQLPPGRGLPVAAVIDPVLGFLHVFDSGACPLEPAVLRVSLSTFSLSGETPIAALLDRPTTSYCGQLSGLRAAADWLRGSAVVTLSNARDPMVAVGAPSVNAVARLCLYDGVPASAARPGRVFLPCTPSRGDIPLSLGVPVAVLLDPSSNSVYVGMESQPARILRMDLTTLAFTHAVQVSPALLTLRLLLLDVVSSAVIAVSHEQRPRIFRMQIDLRDGSLTVVHSASVAVTTGASYPNLETRTEFISAGVVVPSDRSVVLLCSIGLLVRVSWRSARIYFTTAETAFAGQTPHVVTAPEVSNGIIYIASDATLFTHRIADSAVVTMSALMPRLGAYLVGAAVYDASAKAVVAILPGAPTSAGAFTFDEGAGVLQLGAMTNLAGRDYIRAAVYVPPARGTVAAFWGPPVQLQLLRIPRVSPGFPEEGRMSTEQVLTLSGFDDLSLGCQTCLLYSQARQTVVAVLAPVFSVVTANAAGASSVVVLFSAGASGLTQVGNTTLPAQIIAASAAAEREGRLFLACDYGGGNGGALLTARLPVLGSGQGVVIVATIGLRSNPPSAILAMPPCPAYPNGYVIVARYGGSGLLTFLDISFTTTSVRSGALPPSVVPAALVAAGSASRVFLFAFTDVGEIGDYSGNSTVAEVDVAAILASPPGSIAVPASRTLLSTVPAPLLGPVFDYTSLPSPIDGRPLFVPVTYARPAVLPVVDMLTGPTPRFLASLPLSRQLSVNYIGSSSVAVDVFTNTITAATTVGEIIVMRLADGSPQLLQSGLRSDEEVFVINAASIPWGGGRLLVGGIRSSRMTGIAHSFVSIVRLPELTEEAVTIWPETRSYSPAQLACITIDSSTRVAIVMQLIVDSNATATAVNVSDTSRIATVKTLPGRMYRFGLFHAPSLLNVFAGDDGAVLAMQALPLAVAASATVPDSSGPARDLKLGPVSGAIYTVFGQLSPNKVLARLELAPLPGGAWSLVISQRADVWLKGAATFALDPTETRLFIVGHGGRLCTAGPLPSLSLQGCASMSHFTMDASALLTTLSDGQMLVMGSRTPFRAAVFNPDDAAAAVAAAAAAAAGNSSATSKSALLEPIPGSPFESPAAAAEAWLRSVIVAPAVPTLPPHDASGGSSGNSTSASGAPSQRYAFFASFVAPPQIVAVRLPDLQPAGSLALMPSEIRARSAVLDGGAGVAYFVLQQAPGAVVAVQLTVPPRRIGTLSLAEFEEYPAFALIAAEAPIGAGNSSGSSGSRRSW